MQTKQQTKHTPAELIEQGRAGTIAEAKRLIEIQRLEQINDELLEALKTIITQVEAGIVEKYQGADWFEQAKQAMERASK